LKEKAAPTAVDLFCGAGGLGLGLEAAGFEVIAAVDNWRPAVETYNLNFSHSAREDALYWGRRLPDADVYAGGPPCQGFSSAGWRAPGDARNTLVAVFAHLVSQHRPTGFVFENVEGFLTGDQGRWVVDLLSPLVEAGYCISVRKVNAANYGVPQHRKRVLVVGGLGWLPGLPDPTHKATGAPGAMNVANGRPLTPTLAQSLAGLPEPTENGAAPALPDHTFKRPNDDDRRRMHALKPGQTMKDLPEELWHETYRRRAYRRVMDGTPTERRGGAPAGLRRLDPDQPSKAITSGAPSEFVHPVEDRALTLRECARIQTFPDDFQFFGSKAQRALQIGNAVPPRLAEAVAHHVFSALTHRDESERLAPGLYEFTPTFSEGMSPALVRTVELVYASLAVQAEAGRGDQLSLFGRA
tara:strand:+ start:1780 stop:3015 length:1236 start_codon:yes stop_codon:yes gene_type:complete